MNRVQLNGFVSTQPKPGDSEVYFRLGFPRRVTSERFGESIVPRYIGVLALCQNNVADTLAKLPVGARISVDGWLDCMRYQTKLVDRYDAVIKAPTERVVVTRRPHGHRGKRWEHAMAQAMAAEMGL